MLRISLIIGLVLGSIFFLYGTTLADTHTAASCSRNDVLAAITASSDGDTINIPAGDCTWSSGVSLSGPRTIKGQGSDRTIIRMNVGGTTFSHDDIGAWMRYTGIGFYGSPTSAAKAIEFKNGTNFRIDHCRFYPSTWHGVITSKRIVKGLIDHNIFERNDVGGSDYGINWGSNYGTGNPPSCQSYTEPCTSPDCISCRNTWSDWWNNVDNQNTFRPFNGNFVPGTENAIFVEDNVFNWKGSAMEANWGSMANIVVRNNSFSNRDGNNGGVKPGAEHCEIYNNTFENLRSDRPTSAALYIRSSCLVYNNTFKYYDHGGEFAAWSCGFGYCYLLDNPKVLMHDTYIYNNTYQNAVCPGDNSNCWTEWGEGDPNRISENQNYFFRAPRSGDRIYPYTPYTYPHPLTLGDPPPDQPRPAKPKTPKIL